MTIGFRSFLESPAFCGLTLSPLIAAIADASEGIAPSCDEELSQRHFGCSLAELPDAPRRTVAVRAGGRGGKSSHLIGPKAVHAAWTVPLPTLARGEEAVALLVAPDTGLARQTLSFAVGYVEGSAILRDALVDKPTSDGFTLQRPGKNAPRVRVEIRAATRGGRGLRGRTLVFAGMDEACFFFDESTGVVNDADLYRAVLQRVVPGGQVWVASTPWAEGIGLLEDLIGKNFGSHVHALACVAPTRVMNPTWDPDGSIERHLREQDPEAAAREIDAVPVTAGAGSFFDASAVERAIDKTLPLVIAKPAVNCVIAAAMDSGFRNDSSTLAVVARIGDAFALLALEEFRPAKGSPLKPSEVVASFAQTVKPYGVTRVWSDQFYSESIAEELAKHDLSRAELPLQQLGKIEQFTAARRILHEGRFIMPPHTRLAVQLKAMRSKATPGGGMKIDSPRKSGHGDLVSALVGALWAAEQGWAPGTMRAHTGGERECAAVGGWSGF